MNKVFLNTLFVGTQGAYLRLENEQVFVELPEDEAPAEPGSRSSEPRKTVLKVPLHHLGSIVLFGRVFASLPLVERCAEDSRSLVLMTEHGRFRARVQGRTTGNVLLRKAQYDHHADPESTARLARTIVAGKIQNARQVLLRAARDAKDPLKGPFLHAAEVHAALLASLGDTLNIDEIRGAEGMAAAAYFETFDAMITAQRADFRFDGRTRRPPRDRVNCLLSFLYSLWTNDCVAALEGVGLDPQFGFLHVLRPGRPALALDLVEEFRSVFLDRLCLTLINRRQIASEDLSIRDGGSVALTDDGRKKVLSAYQRRKQEEIRHPLLKQKVPIGLLPHIQARLLARHLRGELPNYLPYQP
ncbi:MAG: type I-C CRISPR-associated endonuclease Cas1c [Fimbriimonadaceae bacterium]